MMMMTMIVVNRGTTEPTTRSGWGPSLKATSTSADRTVVSQSVCVCVCACVYPYACMHVDIFLVDLPPAQGRTGLRRWAWRISPCSAPFLPPSSSIPPMPSLPKKPSRLPATPKVRARAFINT